MASITQAIQRLFPGASPTQDFRVEDHLDGKGPQLAFWNANKLGQQPDATTIANAQAAADTDTANEATREASFTSDADRIDVLNRLKTATATQIRTYVNNNVTDLASAKLMLARILIVIALDARS